MPKTLRFFHLLGLCLFAGSIPVHILAGQFAMAAVNAQDFVTAAGHRLTVDLAIQFLTLPGLGLLWLTGIFAWWRFGSDFLRIKWIRAKLLLVLLITLNGILVLTPLAADLAQLSMLAAQSGQLPSNYLDLVFQEDLFGTLNLLMVLSAVMLACYKPWKRRKNTSQKRLSNSFEHTATP